MYLIVCNFENRPLNDLENLAEFDCSMTGIDYSTTVLTFLGSQMIHCLILFTSLHEVLYAAYNK